MCGIAGQISANGGTDLRATTARMADTLHHRGPDDGGLWVDEALGVALAHRRLSILDLSAEGHQPMQSADGRHVMAFNGEVYNHHDLRRELADVPWKGHSDTEVMLAAISRWGLVEAVKRFAGMFAFVLWDRQEHCLHLVRDRFGEKPLYYGWQDGVFLFGSELKALRAHPAWRAGISRDVLALYLKFNYVPAPHSIYEDIFKLEPGCIATVAPTRPGRVETGRYWSLDVSATAPRRAMADDEAVAAVEKALSHSVGEQMVADVPVGAFLSGGVDSSLIAALMQEQSHRPVRTFTIGFHEAAYNEAEHAAAVARHLGTEHTEFYVTPNDALEVIPRLPALYDEPFADSSQIPTHLVARLTRQHVTVSLSGDGGDELFGGYNRYSWGSRIWDRVKILPWPVRKAVAGALRSPSPQAWDRLFSAAAPFLPKRLRHNAPGDKLHKLARLVGARRACEVFLDLISLWDDGVVPHATPPLTLANDPSRWPERLGFTEFMMYLDALTYLPDDILVKVDRATMGVSLESRAPFLDHRVAELAWSLPAHMKVRGHQGKWVLRQLLYKRIPRELIERPKMGFGMPIDSWLRDPLRDWAEALLDEARLRREGFLDPAPVRRKWEEHLSGKRNWQYHLWGVLMFQAWLTSGKSPRLSVDEGHRTVIPNGLPSAGGEI